MNENEIIFNPIAKEDLEDLYYYFSKYSIQYADSFLAELYEFLDNLKQ